MSQAPGSQADENLDAYVQSLQDLYERLDEGMSFSGNERNCVFLNPGSREPARFANASAVSGLDFPDDARGLAFFDWDGDGDLDLGFSNRTAPRIRLMRNAAPPSGNFVSFTLEGDGARTNRDAIVRDSKGTC